MRQDAGARPAGLGISRFRFLTAIHSFAADDRAGKKGAKMAAREPGLARDAGWRIAKNRDGWQEATTWPLDPADLRDRIQCVSVATTAPNVTRYSRSVRAHTHTHARTRRPFTAKPTGRPESTVSTQQSKPSMEFTFGLSSELRSERNDTIALRLLHDIDINSRYRRSRDRPRGRK